MLPEQMKDVEIAVLRGLLVDGEVTVGDFTFKLIRAPGTQKVRLSVPEQEVVCEPVSDVMAVISHALFLMRVRK